MSDPTERIDDLLEEAATVLETHGDSGAEREDTPPSADESALESLSATANEIINTTESQELTHAAGLSAQTVPAAIATGEPAAVARLRAVIQLARLPERSDRDAASVTAIRESLHVAGVEAGGTDESGAEADAESESGAVGTALQSAMTDTLESFTDELTAVQTQLASVGSDAEQADVSEAEDGSPESDGADDENGEDDEDGGLLDDAGSLIDSGDEDEDRPKRSTMYSTMPSSDRADMGSSARLSTVSGRSRYSTMPE